MISLAKIHGLKQERSDHISVASLQPKRFLQEMCILEEMNIGDVPEEWAIMSAYAEGI